MDTSHPLHQLEEADHEVAHQALLKFTSFNTSNIDCPTQITLNLGRIKIANLKEKILKII